MIKLSSYGGNPFLGVYCVANESISFLPLDSSEAFVAELEEALGVSAIRTNIASSHVVGSLMAMNSNGIIVSGMVESDELSRMPKDMNILVMMDKHNAAGNNILLNDNGAIVDPGVDSSTLSDIADALGVECVQSQIAGSDTVGSVCKATNKGVVCHPMASEDDLKIIKDVLRVDAYRSTLNHGAATVGACLVANSKGALVGESSTPVELGRLEDALHLY